MTDISVHEQILIELKKQNAMLEEHFRQQRKITEINETEIKEKRGKIKENLSAVYCEICKIQCRNYMEFATHNSTTKHKKAIGEIARVLEFVCEKCNYKTRLKQNFDKHLSTKSHISK
jgi:hypothetical protein